MNGLPQVVECQALPSCNVVLARYRGGLEDRRAFPTVEDASRCARALLRAEWNNDAGHC
jgi:hypothetical protein